MLIKRAKVEIESVIEAKQDDKEIIKRVQEPHQNQIDKFRKLYAFSEEDDDDGSEKKWG